MVHEKVVNGWNTAIDSIKPSAIMHYIDMLRTAFQVNVYVIGNEKSSWLDFSLRGAYVLRVYRCLGYGDRNSCSSVRVSLRVLVFSLFVRISFSKNCHSLL